LLSTQAFNLKNLNKSEILLDEVFTNALFEISVSFIRYTSASISLASALANSVLPVPEGHSKIIHDVFFVHQDFIISSNLKVFIINFNSSFASSCHPISLK